MILMSVYHFLSGIFSSNILLGFIQQMGDNSKKKLTEILAAFISSSHNRLQQLFGL